MALGGYELITSMVPQLYRRITYLSLNSLVSCIRYGLIEHCQGHWALPSHRSLSFKIYIHTLYGIQTLNMPRYTMIETLETWSQRIRLKLIIFFSWKYEFRPDKLSQLAPSVIYSESESCSKGDVKCCNTLGCLDEHTVVWDCETIGTVKWSRYISSCRGWRPWTVGTVKQFR